MDRLLQDTKFGVRVLLRDRVRLVLGEGMALLGVGIAIGLAGAVAIRRTLQTRLYGVSALDPIVLFAVLAILGAAAALACAIPARRASRIDPSTASSV
jgi:putative ABC transport system permease protein